MTAIHAELTGDQQHIVLLAAGEYADDIALAARRLKALTPLFTKSDPPGALVVAATWPCVIQLSATFGADFVPGPNLCAWIELQRETRLAVVDDTPLGLPVPEHLTPRPYQNAGAREIARTGSALIFDEPRTGKTITAILGLGLALGTDRLTRPIVVVCPAAVVDPWVEAFNDWAPWWKAVAWRGAPLKRHALAGTADVYVSSYDTARVDAPKLIQRGPLRDLHPGYVVADECHLIKNPETGRAQAVTRMALKADGFIGLSGTPITHHPGDLWTTLNCLTPGAWPSSERWRKRYCLMVENDYSEDNLGLHPHSEPEFRLTILGQHRRVARADVMSQLPPKVYSVRTVELPPTWRKAYDDFEARMIAELPDDGGELSIMSVLSKLTHLSSLSSAPADVEITYGPDVDQVTGEPKEHVHLELKGPSWKVDALIEILAERPGEQVVVFAPSRQLIDLAGEAAAAAGHKVGYIVGGQSAAVRTETRRAFQASEIQVVCATTSAGGTGITLSNAGTLVYLQRPWSLVESLQSEDRAEGDMEATVGTEVIDIVARNTLDTRVRAVLRERAGQLADLVQDPRIVSELLGGSSSRKSESEPEEAA